MAKSVTILGPYQPSMFSTDANITGLESAISSAIGSNTCVSCDPHMILGNVFIFITTS